MKSLKPFTVYRGYSGWNVQLRDKNDKIIAVFPTIGGQYATDQLPKQSLRRARYIAKLLNQS